MSGEKMNRNEAIVAAAGVPLMGAAANEVRPQYLQEIPDAQRHPTAGGERFSQHFMPVAEWAGLGPK